MLGKEITDYFCFLPPPFLFPTLKIVVSFLFSAASSSPNLKIVGVQFYALNQIHPNSFAHNFMCELPMFHSSSLFSAFFFSLTWFSFLPFILNSIP